MKNNIFVPFELVQELQEEKEEYINALDNYQCNATDCSECFEHDCPIEYMQGKIAEIEDTIYIIERDYL